MVLIWEQLLALSKALFLMKVVITYESGDSKLAVTVLHAAVIPGYDRLGQTSRRFHSGG